MSKVAGLPADAGIQVPNRAVRRRGIVVHASGTEDMLMISISGAAAGNGAGAGVINTLVAKNTVRAKVDGSTLNASGSEISYQITAEDGKQQKITTSSDVCVEASDEALILDFAGGLAAGSTAGVGATVVVLVFNKTVEAALSGTVAAAGDISVTANAEDDLYLLALAFGAGGTAGVAGGANALVFENSTTAALGGMVVKANDVLVSATADSRLYNIAAGAAGSGTAAVTAVAVVTYFKNTTTAYLADGTVIGTAASPVTGDVAVLANSYEFVTADAAGMSGGGTAGVGGTLDVLVTLVKTSAFTGNNVAVYAAGDVNVRAVDEYDLVAVVVTAAGSGTAAVGVTALVSVSFNTITAVIGETNTIVGKSFTLLASSNRDVVSTVATVAASGVAGVGVSLSVVVSGNKMSQDAHDSLYQNDGSQLTTTRDGTLYLVYDYAYEASGETVHITVYEAPDGKLYRMDSNGNLVPYTVDKAKLTKATAGNLDPQTQLDGAFKLGHSSARANKPGESLNDLLAGDGQRGGEEDYSSYGQDTSGQIYVLANGKYIPVTDEEYESKYNGQQRYLYNSRTKQYEKTSKSASENQQFGSGEDGRANAPDSSQFDSAAEGLGYSSAALDGLKDSTTAEVMGKGTAIRAVGGDINVLAADAVSAVMVSGTVAIGGTGAGVGVGLSSSTFFSNVQALVQSGAILRASGDVNVKASSGASEDVLAPLDKEVEGGTVSQSSVKAELQKQGVGEVNESSALYLISFTAGGGFVGVGVGAATLLVFTQVKAILAGDIAGAQNVNVEGGMDFGRVLTVTSGVSGGAVAVNVSLGATHFGGSVETAIAGNAWLRDVSENINVKTSGKTNVVTAAGTIAGGAGAVNAGVAIATNITEVHTYIGQGVVVDAPAANINLSTTFEANANASIIAIMGGAIAEGASVAISVNRLSAQTYIGTTPQGTAQSGAASSEKGRIAASAVCVESDVQGTSSVYGASIAGGVVAVNGIVALAFNRAAGIAAVNQANLDAASLSVLAQMAGDVIVRTVAAAGGGIAVGATVAVAEQKTDNRALIDASDSRLSISGNITVSAGTKEAPYNSDATVTSITGAAGGVAVAMNFAVATNEAGNRALVQGVSGMLNAHNLIIEAHGNAHAYAVVGNAAAGAIAANVSFAYANLISKQEAMLSGSAALVLTGSLTVYARQNQDEVTGSLLLDYQGSGVDKKVAKTTMAEAYIFSASGAAISGTVNTAIARANATSRAKAAAASLDVGGSIIVTNNANSRAIARMDNLAPLSYASVGVMVGYAYADGTFEALVESNGGIRASGNVTVQNTYNASAEAVVNPAVGGVNVSKYSGKLNVGYAEVKTVANAGVTGSGALAAKAVRVDNTGKAKANAEVKGGYFTGNTVQVVSNTVVARLNATQEAFVKDVFITADSVAVLTDFTPDGTQKRYILRRVEQFNENGEAVLDENGAPALAWILDVVVRYDWIREDYPNPEPRMTLTVVAGGGAYVEELTGSVRGSIKAGGDAAYTVNGGEAGTYTDPLITDVDGTLTITARDDISVKDLGSLDLVANSAKGQINAVAVGDIALKNTNGQSLVIGPVVAGGDGKIIADGALVEGNRYGQEAQVRANNITLQADGEIGTVQNPFDVDTRTGVLSAAGTELVVNEVSGNLTVESIIATVGNVTITAPGSISEAGGAGKAVEDAAQAQQAANAAMDETDAANAQANVLAAYAVREEAKLKAAEDALKSAEEALLNAEKRIAEIEAVLRQAEAIRTDESLTEEERAAQLAGLLGESTTEALSAEQANLLNRLPALQNALQVAQNAEAKQRAVAEPARDAADAAKAEAAAKQEAAVKAQTLADAARQVAETMQPAITLPGDLKLLAGGSIGTEQHPLSVGVSGTVDAEASDGVYLAGFGDLAVARIETGADAVVNATGGLSGGNIHAEKAELNALGGSVGSREMPVALNVKELSGTARDEFHAVNTGDLAIGSVHAGGEAGIASSGSIAASGDAPSNITAEELSISAQGAVGTETALLRINAGNLTISGRGIYIKLIADVTIHTIEGGNIVIDADGNVWGDPETPQREYHIKGDSLDLDAFGSVGTKEVPLRIYIPGKVAVESEWGELHYRNYYVPYGGETSPAAPDVPTTGGAEAALAWCLTLLTAGLWAAARKRRIRKA